MRKFVPVVMFGILMFGYSHIVKPFAKGSVKVVKTTKRVII